MSELSNYIELLLRDDMPKSAKERLAEMIKDAELNIRPPTGVITGVVTSPLQNLSVASQQQSSVQQVLFEQGRIGIQGVPQAASTLAAMARHNQQGLVSAPVPEPQPVAVVAQTPQASAALQSRHEAIAAQISGKPLKGEKQPRKW